MNRSQSVSEDPVRYSSQQRTNAKLKSTGVNSKAYKDAAKVVYGPAVVNRSGSKACSQPAYALSDESNLYSKQRYFVAPPPQAAKDETNYKHIASDSYVYTSKGYRPAPPTDSKDYREYYPSVDPYNHPVRYLKYPRSPYYVDVDDDGDYSRNYPSEYDRLEPFDGTTDKKYKTRPSNTDEFYPDYPPDVNSHLSQPKKRHSPGYYTDYPVDTVAQKEPGKGAQYYVKYEDADKIPTPDPSKYYVKSRQDEMKHEKYKFAETEQSPVSRNATRRRQMLHRFVQTNTQSQDTSEIREMAANQKIQTRQSTRSTQTTIANEGKNHEHKYLKFCETKGTQTDITQNVPSSDMQVQKPVPHSITASMGEQSDAAVPMEHVRHAPFPLTRPADLSERAASPPLSPRRSPQRFEKDYYPKTWVYRR